MSLFDVTCPKCGEYYNSFQSSDPHECPADDTVLNGDHFTHDRMKKRFYCSAVSRNDEGRIISVTLVDSPDKLPKIKNLTTRDCPLCYLNGVVKMPTNADEAAAMQMIGLAWLKQNAPERLKEEKNQFFVYDWMKGAEFFSSEDEAMQSFDERVELQKTTPGGDVAGVCWGLVKRGHPVSFRDGILSRLGGGL